VGAAALIAGAAAAGNIGVVIAPEGTHGAAWSRRG
jgi:hypothetical protein